MIIRLISVHYPCSIDATLSDINEPGRFINHSKQNANIHPKIETDGQGKPRITFYSKRDIKKNEELLYDYGDRLSIEDHPWLKE